MSSSTTTGTRTTAALELPPVVVVEAASTMGYMSHRVCSTGARGAGVRAQGGARPPVLLRARMPLTFGVGLPTAQQALQQFSRGSASPRPREPSHDRVSTRAQSSGTHHVVLGQDGDDGAAGGALHSGGAVGSDLHVLQQGGRAGGGQGRVRLATKG